jgi:23S rRNA (adenine2503-C2)-methyltransferase
MTENLTKINLTSLTKENLENEMVKIGEKPFRAKQIWNWIYARGVKDFAAMTNISNDARAKLEEQYSLARPAVSKDLTSFDGTRKWLLKFHDGQEVEAVFIPETERGTLCISSQVGCTLTCKFCHTGTQMLARNLGFEEIVAQLIIAKDLLDDWDNSQRKITNIVFMGMGEPFFNYENVRQAIKIINDPDGIDFSKRRITVSTSGVVPELIKFADEIKTTLAISLHATTDELRSEIMPINKKYPLKELMAACQYYSKINPSQRITFEYVMLKGVNDSDDDAWNLINLIKKHKLYAIVNLIPFNPWAGTIYECSSRNRIMEFSRILHDAGLVAPIRKTRGQDVMAACGQLKSLSQRPKKVFDKPNLE